MGNSFEEQIQRQLDLLGLKSFFYVADAMGAAIPDDTKDFFVALIRNGCPLDAVTKTIEELSKNKKGSENE